MRLKSLFSLCLVLSACEVSRPEGAYLPKEEPPDKRPTGFEEEDAGEEPEPEPDEDSGVVEPEPDSGDDSMVMVDPSNPLSALQGTYLMRMDYYSTATGSESGSTLVLDNRISNLFFTELKLLEDGSLQATEQLCFQDYENKCVRGCQPGSAWTTDVDNDLTRLFQTRSVTRTYEVSAQGMLVAPPAKMAVGYDPPSAASGVPRDVAEASVWVLGDGSDPVRRGVHTFVEAKVLAAGAIPVDLKCHVDSAQLFVTQFSVQLATLDAASLSAQRIRLDADGSDAVALFADGTPIQVCDKSKLGGGTASKEEQFVRFKQAGALKACPKTIAAFDTTLPPDHRLQ